MATKVKAKSALKDAVKEALMEALPANRDLLREVFTEALEDFALAEAIEAGRNSKKVSRVAIDRMLKGRS